MQNRAGFASGAPWTGLLPTLRSPAPVNQPLSEKIFALHRWLGFLMAAMVSAHAGAALFHHFIRRDRVLMRMVRGG
jgi:cytochrome b561